MCGITTLECALWDAEENIVLAKAHITAWIKTCSIRMPWMPFGKFILPLCQLSLIYAKAVRQHYWFKRLTRTIHGVGVILLFSHKRSIQKGATRQLLLGSRWKDPWAGQAGEHLTDGPHFCGETDFWHCARAMHKSNMRENWQPTSEAPAKSRTHPQPVCKQKRSSVAVILHMQNAGQERT